MSSVAGTRMRRCAAIAITGDQCELNSLHDAVHAAARTDAVVTWTADNRAYRWSVDGPPPPWVRALPWMPAEQ